MSRSSASLMGTRARPLPLLPRGSPARPAVAVTVLAILRPHLPAHAARLGADPRVRAPDHGLASPALERVLGGSAAALEPARSELVGAEVLERMPGAASGTPPLEDSSPLVLLKGHPDARRRAPP